MLYQLSYLGEPLFINNSNILAQLKFSVKGIAIFVILGKESQ